MHPRLWTLLGGLLLLDGVPLTAHGPMAAPITALTARLATEGHDPALFIQRAEFHRVSGDWGAALADLQAAT